MFVDSDDDDEGNTTKGDEKLQQTRVTASGSEKNNKQLSSHTHTPRKNIKPDHTHQHHVPGTSSRNRKKATPRRKAPPTSDECNKWFRGFVGKLDHENDHVEHDE